MRKSEHTVTIPIEDYNELLKAEEFIGLQKIDRNGEIFRIMEQAAHHLNRMPNDTYMKNPLDGYEIYMKKI